MRLLVIDTALDACTAAVAHDGAVLAALSEPMARGHQERLAPLAQEAMAASGLSFAALDRIGVTVGPGSFTGLRVGLAFAKGLGLALDRPVVGIGVLDALAASTPGPGLTVAAIDARREQVYLRRFRDGAPLEAPAALSLDDALDRLGKAPVRLVGSGAPLLAARLPHATVVPVTAPSPEALVTLAETAMGPASPMYLRAPDAKPPRARP